MKKGVGDLSDEIEKQGKDKIVIVISTVLPRTIRSEIKPLLGNHTKLCYNPFFVFIGMGTTMRDFLKPEIVLFGVEDKDGRKTKKFTEHYITNHFMKPRLKMELIKVCYNTFISSKISIVNTIMEMCHHLPNTNVDDVTNATKDV